MKSLSKKKFSLALITGASSGIGTALARELSAHGISLFLTGRDLSKLQALKKELEGRVPVTIFSGDLSKNENVKKLIEKIYEYTPDLVINNAGLGLYGDALSFETKEQKEIVSVNAKALLEITLESARALISEKKSGVILNISSAGDFLVFPKFSSYVASKACVTQLSQSLDFELKKYGIRVLVARPGRVATHFSERASRSKANLRNWLSMDADYLAKKLWDQINKEKTNQIIDWKSSIGTFFLRFLIPEKCSVKILSSSLKESLIKEFFLDSELKKNLKTLPPPVFK